jgi:hypothetical protein
MTLKPLSKAEPRSQEAAEFLCRSDSVEDVAPKCAGLGLSPKAKS